MNLTNILVLAAFILTIVFVLMGRMALLPEGILYLVLLGIALLVPVVINRRIQL